MTSRLHSFVRRPSLIAVLLVAGATLPAGAGADGPPRVSPEAALSQRVGVSEIELRYSRPSVRGRKIWGDLVPWGKIWRTGANEATTLSLSHDAEVDGKSLPAGTYALFTIPRKDRWTVIFNHDAKQWGAYEYREQRDALRISVRPRPAPAEEHLTFVIPEVSTEKARIELRWAGLVVPFEVRFDTARLALAEARRQTSARPGDGRLAWNWAYYFYSGEMNTAEALELATSAARETRIYWTWALKARLLARQGRFAEAVQSAERALSYGEADADPSPSLRGDLEELRVQLSEWKAAG